MPRAPSKKRRSLYSVHPGVAMVQKWIAELPEKTSKSLDEWMQYIRKHGPADEKARREWLKNEHGMGTNTAWWLAERAAEKPKGFAEEDPGEYLKTAEKYVNDMFAGGKESLRPIYDKLLDVCLKLADDVKACPCQTIVPLYRNHVIAQIKPSTRTRIDFGLALKDTKASGRLIDTGGFAKKDRITHRIPITDVKEIDAEVMKWLRKAYDMDA